ncbi:MAG: hypothetical protein R2818_08140 [Flavobacteriales bacterium]
MRTTFLLIGSIWCTLLCAQPGDDLYLMDPCGVLPYLEVDLTGDHIPDLIITGRSEGTDDVPSSSGHCSTVVQCAAGTLLMRSDNSGEAEIPAQLGAHGTLLHSALEEDPHHTDRRWIFGEVLATFRAYGGAARGIQAPPPDLRYSTFIARTGTTEAYTLTAFRVDVDPLTQYVSVHVIATAPYGSDLVW